MRRLPAFAAFPLSGACCLLRRLLCPLAADRRGAVAILFGLLLVPILVSIGLAVDVGRAYYVKQRLSHALDAAALAVGSTVATEAELRALAERYVAANFPGGRTGTPHGVSVSINQDVVRVSAQATVDTPFAAVADIWSMTVSASSEVIRSMRGLDVALVLDNTGSMTTSDNIGALRDASTELVNILFGPEAIHPNLYVSVVPYAASVNPGAEAAGLVAAGPPYDPGDLLGWKGCVVERPSPHTWADTPAPVAEWTRFRWLPAVDNDYSPSNAGTVRYGPSYGNGGAGPNLGCPTPILPLTNDRARVLGDIAAMRAWSRGGTMSDIGMAWGIRTLSPAPPFTEGKAWDEPRWEKAIVLMTDGDNQFYRLTSNAGPNEKNTAVVSDYTGYGRLDEYGLIGTTSTTTAKTTLNSRLADVCRAAKDLGIIVYTVTFTSSINTATRNIYRDCATDPTKWFDSPTQESLRASFRAIAIELSKLRISR